MRVTQQMQQQLLQQQMQQMRQTQKQNPKALTNINSSQDKTYSLGQRLTAIVLNIMDSLTTIDIDGDVVSAKNISEQPLYPGQTIRLEVAGQEDGNMLLKLIESEGGKQNALVAQLTDQLRNLKIPFSDKNINMLRTMHEQGVQVTEESFAKMQQESASLEQLAKLLTQNENQAIDWQQSAKANVLAETGQSETLSLASSVNGQDEEVLKAEKADETKTTSKAEQAEAKLDGKGELAENNKASAQSLKPTLDTKALEMRMRNSLLDLVNNNPAKLTQTLAFMQKHNIPNTLMNTLLSSELMTGKLSMMSSLLESLAEVRESLSPEIKQIYDKLNQLTMKLSEMPEKLDAASLKELMETTSDLQKVIAENEAKSQNGVKAEHFAVAKDAQALLTDSSIPWQNFHVPVQLQREIEDIDIYIKGDARKGGKFNADDGLIYIALNTNNMDRVKVKLDFKPEELKLEFICHSEKVSSFMAANSVEMLENVRNLTPKKVIAKFIVGGEEINFSDLEKVDLGKMTVFDIKV